MATQSRIDEIIIHYTATFEDDVNVTVAVIRGWHVNNNGWADIGYHFVIYQDGSLHEGRPMHVVGAHAPPNTGRLGICYVGGLRRPDTKTGHDTRTPAQLATMTKLLRDLLAGRRDTAKVKVNPNAAVLGHRDVGSTQCPGFDVRSWWRSVQTGVTVSPAPTPTAAPVPLPPVRTPGVHEDPKPASSTPGPLGTAVTGVAVTGASALTLGWKVAIGVGIASLIAFALVLWARRK